MIVAGATGKPARIDLAQYRDAITRAPGLIYHLAHLVTPGMYQDGQPRSRDMQAAPGRLTPLDEAEAVFAWLWKEAGRWTRFARLEAAPIGHMVRRDGELHVIGSRHILSSDEGREGILADAQYLMRAILYAWPDIESCYAIPEKWGATTGRQWADDVDKHLLGPLQRWPLDERAPVPERGRKCPLCGKVGHFTQGADTERIASTCLACEKVLRREAWATAHDAAKVLGVGEATVYRWTKQGLPYRATSKGRMVELGAARAFQAEKAARRALNLPNETAGMLG